MIKLTSNTKIYFYNRELGYVGRNTVEGLVRKTEEGFLQELSEKGYYEPPESSDDFGFIEMYVVIKCVPKRGRGTYTQTRDCNAYDNIKEYLENTYEL
jgi:hypothetical protein